MKTQCTARLWRAIRKLCVVRTSRPQNLVQSAGLAGRTPAPHFYNKLFPTSRTMQITFALLLAFAVIPQGLLACTVCFGDPNSPMVHGAKAGVLLLLGVVGLVLGGIGGVTFYWIRRARLIQVQAAVRGESPDV